MSVRESRNPRASPSGPHEHGENIMQTAAGELAEARVHLDGDPGITASCAATMARAGYWVAPCGGIGCKPSACAFWLDVTLCITIGRGRTGRPGP
jgi:hypothetical protein